MRYTRFTTGFRPLALGALLALGLAAAPARAGWQSFFTRADTDRDDRLSADEYMSQQEAWFRYVDIDNDNYWIPNELAAARLEAHKAMDRDRDRAISRAEFMAHWSGPAGTTDGLTNAPPDAPPAPFDELDANHDGRVSRQELEAWSEAHFQDLDKDRNGTLSPSEAQAEAEQVFRILDADRDGMATHDEFVTYLKGKAAAASVAPSPTPPQTNTPTETLQR